MPPPPAAAPEPFPGFSADQNGIIGRLSNLLKVLGPLLILLGVARGALGVVETIRISWKVGIWLLPEAALWIFAGLASIAGSTDAYYLREVKGREKAHLLNTFTSIKAAAVALLILSCYLAVVSFVRIWI